MRRLIRVDCPGHVQVVLDRRQSNVDGGARVSVEWGSFRKLTTYRDLRDVLAEGLGWRRRCAYCSDSLGVDVEHFWPKEKFPERAFRFENFFLICSACNRKKLERFPRSGSGEPMLIDPFFDDPWDSLFFSQSTGWISARLLQGDDGTISRSPKGVATLKVLGDQINSQPAVSARRRSWLELVRRFEELIDSVRVPSSASEAFGDIDDFGLGEWLLNREGKEVAEVVALRQAHPKMWRQLRELGR